MATTADSIIIELRARLDQYERDLRRAERRFDDTMRGIRGESRRMERDVSRNADAVGQQFRALAGTIAAAFSAQQIAQLADGYTRFTNQLKVAGLEGAALADVQEQLFAIGQKNGVQLEILGSLYGRVSQSAGDLGASSAQILELTRGVAAGLRVQGASAEQASGAILGLVQALGSTTVKAEEFNQINEGAPALLRGVAQNIDAAGGSISKLRTLVVEGKVTNTEFFEAFLAGSAALQEQAEKANLTIANSFTVLNNALGKYIGEADQSLSATEQISGAIISLSENLDTVATAIGVLSAVLIGRFAAGMVAGAASTGVASAAIFALQARAIGAATTLEALAFAGTAAGRALLAAFGGPVGLAVTALTLGIFYLATQTESAEQRVQSLAKSADDAAAEADRMEARLRAAGVAMYQVDEASGDAASGIAGVGRSAKSAERDLYDLEQQAIRTATALIDTRLQENTRRRVEVGRDDRRGRTAAGSREASDSGDIFGDRGRRERNAEAEQLDREFRELTRQRNAIIQGVRNGVDVNNNAPPPRPGASGAPTGRPARTGSPSGRSTVDPEAAARAFADDVARGELELRRALADAVGTAAARREVEREAIRVEQESNARAIKADEDLTDAQREKLLALNDQIAAARLAAIAAEGEREAIENGLLLRQQDLRNQQDVLRLQAQLADTAKERRAIELRLLDLQYEEERIRLQAIADNEALAAAEREAARRRLASLDEQQGLERERVERDTEGPLERRRRELNRSPEQLEELAEQWVVDTLDSVQSRLRDAISNAIGVDDPLLASILDLFIEQVILRPIADALAAQAGGAGGGGGGGLASFFTAAASIFAGGRASGGHVMGGRMYRVNETGIEGFQPAGSGKIIPLGRMRGAGGGGSVVFQPTFNIDASGVNPDGFADHIVRAVRKETVAIVGEGMKRVNQGVPARLAQYERDGN